MKKLIVLLLLAVPGWSLETKDNPDKVPSLGLTYTGAVLKGDEDFSGVNFVTAQPQDKETLNQIVADLRFPVSNNLTLEAGAGYSSDKFESNDGSLANVGGQTVVVTTPTSATMTGPVYKVGARYYFQ